MLSKEDYFVATNLNNLTSDLLNMSSKSKLLNFNQNKNSIEIVDEKSEELYKILVTDLKEMEFLPDNSGFYKNNVVDNTWKFNNEVKDSHIDLNLQTRYSDESLKKKLSNLYKSNKTILDEQGYNSLYIALCFLYWKEVTYQETVNKAPLILIPITIYKESYSSPYKIKWNSEEIKYNISLEIKLKEQEIDFPIFENLDDKKDLIEYLKQIKEIVDSKDGWGLTDEIVIDNFDFKKFVMYRDLNVDNWKDIENNHIKVLFGENELNKSFNDSDELYEKISSVKSSDFYNVLDADSSQLAVIDEVNKGNDLVVEGPPGTGKSQTIVNIIAELMARNKKILFVSEKQSALDVVKSRLKDLGLDDGCLELYGKDHSKKEFLNDLIKVLNRNPAEDVNERKFDELDNLKKSLNEYYDSLNSNYKNTDYTNYELIGILESNSQILRKNYEVIPVFEIGDISNLNKNKINEISKSLNNLDEYYSKIGHYENNWLVDDKYKKLKQMDIHGIQDRLDLIIKKIDEFNKVNEHIHNLTGVNKVDNFNINEFISKLYLIQPNFKLLGQKEELINLVEDIKKLQDLHNLLNLTNYDDIKLLKKELDLIGNINIDNLESSYSKYKLIDKDLMDIINSISKFNNKLKDLEVEVGLDSDLNDLNSLYNNLLDCLNFDEDYYFVDKDCLNNITNNFKSYYHSLSSKIEEFKLKSHEISVDVFEYKNFSVIKSQVNSHLNNLNDLSINYKKILDINEFKNLVNDFKKCNNFIHNSKLYPIFSDVDGENKLREFLEDINKSKFLKFFSKNDTLNQIRECYPSDYTDNEIGEDIEKLLRYNEELNSLRKKILAYSNSNIDNEKIIVDSENLILEYDNLNNIIEDLSEFKINVNIKTIDNDINNLINIQDLFENFNNEKISFDEECDYIMESLISFQDKLINEYISSKNEFINEVDNLLIAVNENDYLGRKYFNDLWNSYNSSVEDLRNYLKDLSDFTFNYQTNFFNDKTIEFINENKNFNCLNEDINHLKNLKSDIFKQFNDINQIIDLSNFLTKYDIELMNLSDLELKFKSLYNDMEKINFINLFEEECDDLSLNENLINLIDIIKKDELKSKTFSEIFYYNFANKALSDVFVDEKPLITFNKDYYERQIEKFKDLDDEVLKLNQLRIKKILSDRRPDINGNLDRDDPRYILKAQLNKKRNIMSIRKILNCAAGVISDIKPCFMMSPVSIAQYLSPETFESYFDYVIFDEASQVKVADAIGAMMRGRHYVVIGDTKQLPPSSFFESLMEDENEDFDNVRDYESILNLCKNHFNTKVLKWHYRSKHESLIEFSNHNFYDDELYIFPSPIKKSKDFGLIFEYDSNTVYNNKKNIKEAEKVVDYACKCFDKYGFDRSLGIATFSQNQQRVIEDVLEKKLKENPEYEQFFNENSKTGFFIKNLENIQGDERDIILISIGYGKNEYGKLSLRFGPLNNEGGEKRLNVLITRAKQLCVIFVNFKSSDMRHVENKSRGVKIFKDFLYYAETGKLPINQHNYNKDFDSGFEESVFNFLENNGFVVESQVGCAGYRIDLAIVDKNNEDNYILGIECDGSRYHSSRFARDRDKIRQRTLERLGWKIYRIWSTDWYRARNNAQKSLLSAIKEANNK